jgi:hypothetical protein
MSALVEQVLEMEMKVGFFLPLATLRPMKSPPMQSTSWYDGASKNHRNNNAVSLPFTMESMHGSNIY